MVALRALERLDDRVPDSQPSVRAKIREGTVSFYLYGCPVPTISNPRRQLHRRRRRSSSDRPVWGLNQFTFFSNLGESSRRGDVAGLLVVALSVGKPCLEILRYNNTMGSSIGQYWKA